MKVDQDGNKVQFIGQLLSHTRDFYAERTPASWCGQGDVNYLQSSMAVAYKKFEEGERMKPSAYYDRIVDVMEELVQLTVLTEPDWQQSTISLRSG
ncbi:hypothetical protein JK205_07310 [Gluconobacter cerinus]|nr:hypothetical protein [Gluconobacter cerinus]